MVQNQLFLRQIFARNFLLWAKSGKSLSWFYVVPNSFLAQALNTYVVSLPDIDVLSQDRSICIFRSKQFIIKRDTSRQKCKIFTTLLNPQSGYIKMDTYLIILCHVISVVRLSHCFFLSKVKNVFLTSNNLENNIKTNSSSY